MIVNIVSAFLLLCFFVQHGFAATDKVVCYYTTWSIYRPAKGNFNATLIDPFLCTHINYGFYGVMESGTLTYLDEYGDIWFSNIKQVRDLKKINPDLKTLISVGGDNETRDAERFSNIITSKELRDELVFTSTEWIPMYGFNGIDIVWKYPQAKDKENFTMLLKELREAYEPTGYLISITVSAMLDEEVYDVPAISKYVDMIHLITYDFHTAADGVTGENAPLYSGGERGDINASVNAWIKAGADPAKINIGLAFYGRTYTLTDPSNNGVGAPVNGVGYWSPYTKDLGIMGYNEICEFTTNWTRVFDDEQKIPYKYLDNQWISYDDEESIALKVQYAKDNNLGGVMVWAVDTDDFLGISGTKFGLLEVINSTLKN